MSFGVRGPSGWLVTYDPAIARYVHQIVLFWPASSARFRPVFPRSFAPETWLIERPSAYTTAKTATFKFAGSDHLTLVAPAGATSRSHCRRRPAWGRLWTSGWAFWLIDMPSTVEGLGSLPGLVRASAVRLYLHGERPAGIPTGVATLPDDAHLRLARTATERGRFTDHRSRHPARVGHPGRPAHHGRLAT